MHVAGAKAAWFRILEEGRLNLVAHKNLSPAFVAGIPSIDVADSAAGNLLRAGMVGVLPVEQTLPQVRSRMIAEGIHHLVVIPILGKSSAIGIVALLGQMPGGAIVDAARSERLVAALAVSTIAFSALGYAVWPLFPVVMSAATLHAAASCVLGPAIAAISLGLVGPFAIGERLGRNARYASLGNGVAAAVMGACGYYLSSRSVFLVTFILAFPTLLALSRIRESEVDATRAHGAVVRDVPDAQATSVAGLVRQRPLLIFAGAVLLLQLANAAMLPLMAGVVTTRSSQWAPVLIAACIIVPQAIVALTSPTVGRFAQSWGRRPLLLLGFGALTMRGLLIATVSDPYVLVAVQAFDGITAAVFSVMIPLIVADITFGSGHFNLAQGIVGTATGIGASLSTVLAGYAADRFGGNVAFIGLAAVGATALTMVWAVMPETRPRAS